MPLKAGNRSDGLQPLRDLDSVRSFLSGSGPIALFDLPWMPIYLVICFVFPSLDRHDGAGRRASSSSSLTMLTEVHDARADAGGDRSMRLARNRLAEASRRNAEALAAMGMTGRDRRRAGARPTASTWRASARRATSRAGFGAISKVLRMMLQSGVLAVGAWLVINQQATAGIIIAGSIL